jgi:hypothetical protein
MGCGKSNLNQVYDIEIPKIFTCHKNIESYQTYEHAYLTYCIKCDILGLDKKTIHCEICDRCHHITQYIHCTKCNICLNPLCDRDTIRHRKLHKNL